MGHDAQIPSVLPMTGREGEGGGVTMCTGWVGGQADVQQSKHHPCLVLFQKVKCSYVDLLLYSSNNRSLQELGSEGEDPDARSVSTEMEPAQL